jgi:hypothetical protein
LTTRFPIRLRRTVASAGSLENKTGRLRSSESGPWVFILAATYPPAADRCQRRVTGK